MSDDRIQMRRACSEDQDELQRIRASAFEPVFASFRSLLGDELYELAQQRDDEAQADLLASMFGDDAAWELHVAEHAGRTVGFVSILLNHATGLGEIGLTAIDPAHGGRGFGTQMFEFAVEQMKRAGMRVATVSTGGDESHAPARRAYQKAGFDAAIPSVWMCRKL